MDLFSTNNTAVQNVAIGTGLVAVGFGAGLFVGRSFKKKSVAESYVNDLASELGVKVDAKNVLTQLEEQIKKAPKVEAKKPVAQAAPSTKVENVQTAETVPVAEAAAA